MHILKKGYEMQKRSLIANMDLYMTEKDANSEFFPLLVVRKTVKFTLKNSMEYWDDSFQA